jgi:hypothetical protein
VPKGGNRDISGNEGTLRSTTYGYSNRFQARITPLFSKLRSGLTIPSISPIKSIPLLCHFGTAQVTTLPKARSVSKRHHAVMSLFFLSTLLSLIGSFQMPSPRQPIGRLLLGRGVGQNIKSSSFKEVWLSKLNYDTLHSCMACGARGQPIGEILSVTSTLQQYVLRIGSSRVCNFLVL